MVCCMLLSASSLFHSINGKKSSSNPITTRPNMEVCEISLRLCRAALSLSALLEAAVRDKWLVA